MAIPGDVQFGENDQNRAAGGCFLDLLDAVIESSCGVEIEGFVSVLGSGLDGRGDELRELLGHGHTPPGLAIPDRKFVLVSSSTSARHMEPASNVSRGSATGSGRLAT